MIVCIIIIFLLIITILSLIIYNKYTYSKREKELQKKVEDNFIKTKKKELEDNLLIKIADAREKAELQHANTLARLREEQQKLEGIIATETETINQLEKRKEEQKKAITEAIADRQKLVDTQVAAYQEIETQKARTVVDAETAAMQKFADVGIAEYWEKLAQETQQLEQKLVVAAEQLEDYKKKQAVINEAILRQRELEEKQDFYRICLSPENIEDIKLLQEIRTKLHTSDSLNKLIYDAYVGKQVQEMVKRVLQGREPSGIYKITRLKTGEVYVGKSTNVRDRFLQHAKTVFGCGTIAHSMLHTTMERDGIENFTFELLEKVPKDKLTEREKYWITFYDSKKYGLNERVG